MSKSEVIEEQVEGILDRLRAGLNVEISTDIFNAKSQILKLISEARIDEFDNTVKLVFEHYSGNWTIPKGVTATITQRLKDRRAELSSTNSEAREGGGNG